MWGERMKRILFVEDDEQYRKLLTTILEKEGYQIDSASSPIDAMGLFEKDKYDLLISDFKMEAIDGLKLIEFIKKVDNKTRTMILTASPSDESEIESLELKIDKYVVKETRIEILLKYVEYLLLLSETMKHQENEVLSAPSEGIILDLDARKVTKAGIEHHLTAKQFGMLKILLENKGKAVSRDEIIESLWDEEFEVIDTRIVDGHIKELRKKMDIQSIVSIRGYGYKWNE